MSFLSSSSTAPSFCEGELVGKVASGTVLDEAGDPVVAIGIVELAFGRLGALDAAIVSAGKFVGEASMFTFVHPAANRNKRSERFDIDGDANGAVEEALEGLAGERVKWNGLSVGPAPARC